MQRLLKIYHLTTLLFFSFSGFILTYKGTAGQWHETRLPASRQNFVLENLQCGTSYQIVLTAVNSVGHGEPSEMIQVTTNGRGTIVNIQNTFLIKYFLFYFKDIKT